MWIRERSPFQLQSISQQTSEHDTARGKTGFQIKYRSPTKIPNRDKKTESPYLVHPLTYRQVYLTKDAYFVEKIHCELVEMAVGQRMNKIRFSCHNIYWFGFLVTIRNFRRAPVAVERAKNSPKDRPGKNRYPNL